MSPLSAARLQRAKNQCVCTRQCGSVCRERRPRCSNRKDNNSHWTCRKSGINDQESAKSEERSERKPVSLARIALKIRCIRGKEPLDAFLVVPSHWRASSSFELIIFHPLKCTFDRTEYRAGARPPQEGERTKNVCIILPKTCWFIFASEYKFVSKRQSIIRSRDRNRIECRKTNKFRWILRSHCSSVKNIFPCEIIARRAECRRDRSLFAFEKRNSVTTYLPTGLAVYSPAYFVQPTTILAANNFSNGPSLGHQSNQISCNSGQNHFPHFYPSTSSLLSLSNSANYQSHHLARSAAHCTTNIHHTNHTSQHQALTQLPSFALHSASHHLQQQHQHPHQPPTASVQCYCGECCPSQPTVILSRYTEINLCNSLSLTNQTTATAKINNCSTVLANNNNNELNNIVNTSNNISNYNNNNNSGSRSGCSTIHNSSVQLSCKEIMVSKSFAT